MPTKPNLIVSLKFCLSKVVMRVSWPCFHSIKTLNLLSKKKKKNNFCENFLTFFSQYKNVSLVFTRKLEFQKKTSFLKRKKKKLFFYFFFGQLLEFWVGLGRISPFRHPNPFPIVSLLVMIGLHIFESLVR